MSPIRYAQIYFLKTFDITVITRNVVAIGGWIKRNGGYLKFTDNYSYRYRETEIKSISKSGAEKVKTVVPQFAVIKLMLILKVGENTQINYHKC